MNDYKSSTAYQRSNRQRPDGKPLFPLTFADRPVERKERATS